MRQITIFSTLLFIGFFSIHFNDAKGQTMASKEVVYKSDIKGQGCAIKVSEALQEQQGVESTSVNLEEKTIKVKYNPASTNKANIQKTIEDVGYFAQETTVYKGKAKTCCSERKVEKKGCCGK